MKRIRIALAQFLPLDGQVAENAEKILNYMKAAFEQGAEVICFPECSLSGYRTEKIDEIAVDAVDPQIQRIRLESKKHRIAVCFGYIERTEKGFYITQELTYKGDSVFYRKTHLGTKEKEVFLEGNEFPVCSEPVCTGIQLCWESHIPEISAIERKKGAQLLLVPYASPMRGERCCENWSVHLPARASDNGVYLAACNLLFPKECESDACRDGKTAVNDPKECESDACRGGGMAVYDPKGRRIAEHFHSEEHMIFCDLQGPLPRESRADDMHSISYFDRKRTELF